MSDAEFYKWNLKIGQGFSTYEEQILETACRATDFRGL